MWTEKELFGVQFDPDDRVPAKMVVNSWSANGSHECKWMDGLTRSMGDGGDDKVF